MIKMTRYVAVLQHDKGKVRLHVTATDEATAIDMLMKAEGCPRNAILSIKPE
jgi:type III secretory pathway lipoprotein EscJ